jgi:hypothetical protein
MKSVQNIPLEALRAENATSFSIASADYTEAPRAISISLTQDGVQEENDRLDAVLWASSWYAFDIALQLADQGVLDLDASLGETLPFLGFNDKSQKNLTIRDLLTQSSDLPNKFDYGFATSRPDRNYLKYLVKGSRSYRQSPRLHKLNPVDLSLLELVLEQVTGKIYAQLFHESIILPHGFKQTFLSDEEIEGKSNLRNGKQSLYFNALAYAGVMASAQDFVVYARHFQTVVHDYKTRYLLDTDAWFNGFAANAKVRYLYIQYCDIQRFILLDDNGKTISASAVCKNDLLPVFLDLAQSQGVAALEYRDLPEVNPVEKATIGLFAGKGKTTMLNEVADSQGIIRLNKRAYLVESLTTRQNIRLQRIIMQSVDSIPSVTWWHSKHTDCILNKIHPGENLSRLEWFLRPTFRKEAPNTMLCGPVYHVVDSHLALPAVDLPSDWRDDCEELRHETDKVVQGLHEYLPLSLIPYDANRLVLEEGKIAWTRSHKNLDTIKLIGTIVMIVLDKSGKIRFDSRKHSGLDLYEEEMFYGFFGKKDGEILPVWEVIRQEVESETPSL